MVCVDNSVTDLVAGYDFIQQNEKRVDDRYAQRQREALEQNDKRAQEQDNAQGAWTARRSLLSQRIVLGVDGAVIVTSLVFFAWMLIAPTSWSASAIPGFLGMALCGAAIGVGAFIAWQRFIGQRPGPLPVAAPLPPPPSLLADWQSAMKATLPPPDTVWRADDSWTWGYEGEYKLVTGLTSLATSDAFQPYILASVRPRHGDDLDAVVVCQRGIWLFEVKHWSGRVTWHAGRWEHAEKNAQGGETLKVHNQWPDEQWMRMVDEIQFTLNRRAAGVVKRYPHIMDIQGGIVFTHDHATLEIGSIFPMAGSLSRWLSFFPAQHGLVSINERTALEIVEALLSRHNEVTAQQAGVLPARRSMLDEARRLVNSALA